MADNDFGEEVRVDFKGGTMQRRYFSNRSQCPACTSKHFRELYKTPFDEPPVSDYLKSFYIPQGGIDFEYLKNVCFSLYECSRCGLIFQKEIPGDLLMGVIYDKWLDPKKAFEKRLKTDDLDRSAYYAQEISTIIAFLGKRPWELRFLDFGMGWGKWALMAKGMGCQSYGTELSKDRREFARSNGIRVAGWDEIPEYRFDFINTEQVFEHLPHPLDTLVYLKDALKEGGIIKISVPMANNITIRLKRMDWQAPKGTRHSLKPVTPLEHINYFRRKSLIMMAELAGMQEVTIPMATQYAFTTNWRGPKRIAKNLVRPIYRNILKRHNYLFFKKQSSEHGKSPGRDLYVTDGQGSPRPHPRGRE